MLEETNMEIAQKRQQKMNYEFKKLYTKLLNNFM